MTEPVSGWEQSQRRRWMRHDAQRWIRPDAHRWMRPGFESTLPSLDRKYSEDQPRVPAGSPYGGEWTRLGVRLANPLKLISAPSQNTQPQRIAAKISPVREAECERQYAKDVFICNAVQKPSCYAQAMRRYAACLRGDPAPPLIF